MKVLPHLLCAAAFIGLAGCVTDPEPEPAPRAFDAIPYLGKPFRVSLVGAVFAPVDYSGDGWDGTVDQATINRFTELAAAPGIALGSPAMLSLVGYVTGLTINGTALPDPLGTSQVDTGDGVWRDQIGDGRDNLGFDSWDSLKTEAQNSLYVVWKPDYQPSYAFRLKKATRIRVHLVDYDPLNANDEAGTCTITSDQIAQASQAYKTVDVPCLEETKKNVVSIQITSTLIE